MSKNTLKIPWKIRDLRHFNICLPSPRQSITYALQRNNTNNSKQIFPEKELHGLSPNFLQFSHSCVCERFIYSHDRYAYYDAGKYVDRSW
jgi:hypothetical protein